MTNPAQDLDFLPYSALYGGKDKPQQTGTPEQNRYEQNKGFEEYEGLDVVPYKEPTKESFIDNVRRNIARTAARGSESVVGLPGDILDFIIGGGAKLGRKIGLGDEGTLERASNIRKYLPTSQNIRENITEKLTGDYLKPKGEGEEISDEFFSDLATLSLPIKGKIPFARSLGMALAGTLGKEGVKSLGGSSTASQLAKLGLMTIAGLVNKGNAKTFGNNLYKEAIQTIPEEAKTGSQAFTQNVDKFITALQKGGLNPDKQPAYGLARQLKQKIKEGRGQINADELPEFRKSINSFRFKEGRRVSDAAQYNLDRFDDLINRQLLDYGKENPSFLSKYRDANTAISGFKQSNKIARSISKHYDISKLDPSTAVLLGLHFANPSIAAKIAGGIGAAKGAALLKRVTSNPVLQKYYKDVLESALKDNITSLTRNIALLDKEIRKDSESNRQE